MLCAPGTYDIEARQTLWNCSFDAADAPPRYVKLSPGACVSAFETCSWTGIRSVSAPPGICPPKRLANCEKPSSYSKRLVAGEDQVAWVIFSRSSHTLPA